MTEVKPKLIVDPIKPKVGDRVTSKSCRIANELVSEVNDMGFICEYSGQWEGTSDDWKISTVGA